MKSKSDVVVRMAPSPTGNLHIGTARTALFNFLFARQRGGKYILRLEDTDKERSTREFETNILEGLEWLGLGHDEFYRQSERTEVYAAHTKRMIEEGRAYVSKEEPKEEGQRSEVVRFKNPNKIIVFDDLVRGKIEFDTTELGDFVIARSAEEPLYHLAVVIDDFQMRVTHVIRGEDHISNTPRQLLLQEALGAERPQYAHIPLIFDESRAKLSKRKHGEKVWIDSYKSAGYLPEAMLNYVALLGWHPEGDDEILALDELIKRFDISRVQKGGAIFDEKKLRWVNKQHMVLQSAQVKSQISKLLEEKYNTAIHPKIAELVLERIEVFSDIYGLIEARELDYFFSEPTIEKAKIPWKNIDEAETKRNLEKALKILDSAGDMDEIIREIESLSETAGKGSLLWPLRYSLSGREKSPDPYTLVEALGAEESARRVRRAIEILQ